MISIKRQVDFTHERIDKLRIASPKILFYEVPAVSIMLLTFLFAGP